MKKYILLSLIALCLCKNTLFAQAGMNSNTPDMSSVLDISATNKGLLPPRISLTSTTDGSVVNGGTPAEGLLVYNTNSSISGSGSKGVGYYYWQKGLWKKFATKEDIDTEDSWLLAGNSQVNSETNFLGTQDDNAVVVKTNNTERLRLTVNSTSKNTGAVGLGVNNPDHKLDVNASGNGVKFRNLATTAKGVSTNTVNIDANGELTLNTSSNKIGELLRYGINAPNFTLNESALRSDLCMTDDMMKIAPNGGSNFINTITNGYLSTIDQPAGINCPARTTEAITLEAGIYRLTVRIVGNFTASNANNRVSLKVMVNNMQNSFASGLVFCTSTTMTSGLFTDILNLDSTSNIDFTTIVEGSIFTPRVSMPMGSGYSYRSVIIIERIK